MNKSLLFLPDISGFTEFVQSTEKEHSQHVISELLEVLIEANSLGLELAEIEGDALFFYKENEVPSLEQLLAQVETMFTTFYSHLKLLEKNRVCPCNACSSAVNLELKIIAHIGELQFISVQNNRKPFGAEVIEVHRLMKNSIESDNYVLLSNELVEYIKLQKNYKSKLFDFTEGENEYDGKIINYLYSKIDTQNLKLKVFGQFKKIKFNKEPNIKFEKKFPISATELLELITNYSYRHNWVKGVDKLEFNENEITRIGTEHICVIGSKQLNFVVVTKKVSKDKLVYGELTTSTPIIDEFYQFYVLNPLSNDSCNLEVEVYWKSKSIIKDFLFGIIAKRKIINNINNSLNDLKLFVESKIQ